MIGMRSAASIIICVVTVTDGLVLAVRLSPSRIAATPSIGILSAALL